MMVFEFSVPAMAPAEIVASTWFGGKLRLDFGDGADMDMDKDEAAELARALRRLANGYDTRVEFNTRARQKYGADALRIEYMEEDRVLMTLNRNTCEFYVELCLKAPAVAELARWLREASE